jgi:ABC-2 type transport system permease protein
MNANTFPILLKREYWENRGGFLRAPIAVAIAFTAVLLMAWVWGEVSLHRTGINPDNFPLNALAAKFSDENAANIVLGYQIGMVSLSGVMQVVLAIVLFFYLIGALYDDRRDRSVLFWKSLPVSDTATVMSKVTTALFVAPLMAFGATVALHIAVLSIVSLFLLFHGVSPWHFVWGTAQPLSMWTHLLATIPVAALWVLPTVGWLLLVSSFARSKPFIWAVLPPLGVGILLSWFHVLREFSIPSTWYWSHVFARLLFSFSPGSWGNDGRGINFGINVQHGRDVAEIMSWGTLGNALANPELWIGAVAGAAMIAGAVYFRRVRELAD